MKYEVKNPKTGRVCCRGSAIPPILCEDCKRTAMGRTLMRASNRPTLKVGVRRVQGATTRAAKDTSRFAPPDTYGLRKNNRYQAQRAMRPVPMPVESKELSAEEREKFRAPDCYGLRKRDERNAA